MHNPYKISGIAKFKKFVFSFLICILYFICTYHMFVCMILYVCIVCTMYVCIVCLSCLYIYFHVLIVYVFVYIVCI